MKFYFLILSVGALLTLKAQSYNTAVGLRMGNQFGPTVQQNLVNKLSLEGIVQFNFRGKTQAAVLLEQHRNLLGRRLNYYYGIGPHRIWETNYEPAWGLSGILGLELTMLGLNVSFDYKPTYNPPLATTGNVRKRFEHETALSVRKVIAKRKRNKQAWKFWKK